jgi:hypothetical protein
MMKNTPSNLAGVEGVVSDLIETGVKPRSINGNPSLVLLTGLWQSFTCFAHNFISPPLSQVQQVQN